MEKYRKRLIRNSIGYILLIILFLLVWIIFDNPFGLPVPFSANHLHLQEGVTGGVFGGSAVLLYYAISAISTVKNPKLLAEKYQKKLDERDIIIERNSYAATCRILMYLSIPAWSISAAFSKAAFCTLLCVMIVSVALYYICHTYYAHKF